MIFRVIALISFVVLAGGLFLAWRHTYKFPDAGSWLRGQLRFRPPGAKKTSGMRLVYLGTLLATALLVLSGFTPVVLAGHRLSGILMLVHVTVVPFFVAGLACLTVVWAERHRLTADDWGRIRQGVGRKAAKRKKPGKDGTGLFSPELKVGFWLLAALSLPLILSMLLAMSPYFGFESQAFFFELHRYSALAFSLVAIYQTFHLIARAGAKQKSRKPAAKAKTSVVE